MKTLILMTLCSISTLCFAEARLKSLEEREIISARIAQLGGELSQAEQDKNAIFINCLETRRQQLDDLLRAGAISMRDHAYLSTTLRFAHCETTGEYREAALIIKNLESQIEELEGESLARICSALTGLPLEVSNGVLTTTFIFYPKVNGVPVRMAWELENPSELTKDQCGERRFGVQILLNESGRGPLITIIP